MPKRSNRCESRNLRSSAATTYVPTRMTALRTLPLAIEHGHALRVGRLPPHHRDPFDRLIVAQALEEDVPVLTSDSIFLSTASR
jgi:PIN domain nuclease of toxin-antitoxin system